MAFKEQVCSIGTTKVNGGYSPTVDLMEHGCVKFPDVFVTEQEAVDFAKEAVSQLLKNKLDPRCELSFETPNEEEL